MNIYIYIAQYHFEAIWSTQEEGEIVAIARATLRRMNDATMQLEEVWLMAYWTWNGPKQTKLFVNWWQGT